MMSSATSLPFEFRSGGLIVRFKNRDVIERKDATFRALAELIKTHKATVFLADFRAIPGEITFLDRYELGEMAARHLLNVAIGVLSTEALLDPGRIGAMVAANRGAQVDVFTDPADADAWFEKKTKPAADP